MQNRQCAMPESHRYHATRADIVSRVRRFLRTVIVAAVAIAAAEIVTDAAKVNVRAEYDRKIDFKRFDTWAWDPEEAGDVKMARSSQDDPVPIKRRFGPTIVDAVASELGARGLRAAPAGDAHLRFHYYLIVTAGTETQTMGQFLPAVPEWGLPPFAPQTTSFNIIQQGSLVLDAVSAEHRRVVWRAIARTEIDEMRTDTERDARIRQVVRELARRLPKK